MSEFYNGQRLTHLTEFEALLWIKFLEEHGTDYFNYTYDKHLSKPLNFPKELQGNQLLNAQMLSSLRIDVICESKNSLYIVEIRKNATMSVIGNVVAYRFLYKFEFNPVKPVGMIIITNQWDPQVELAARAIGALYYVY